MTLWKLDKINRNLCSIKIKNFFGKKRQNIENRNLKLHKREKWIIAIKYQIRINNIRKAIHIIDEHLQKAYRMSL
jgi:hypothetical protein